MKTDKNTHQTPSGHPSQTELASTDNNQCKDQGIKFNPGEIVATTNAMNHVTSAEIARGLSRHLCGDWGDVCPEDWKVNDEALEIGDRIISSYRTSDGLKFWIITEWDRSYTTVLLPEDY